MRRTTVIAGLLLGVVGAAGGCGQEGGSGRTELVPDSPSGQWRDRPLWYNQPVLVPAQSNSVQAQREREQLESEKSRVAEERRKIERERAALEAQRRALDAGQTGGLDTTPRMRRDVKDTPKPTSRPG